MTTNEDGPWKCFHCGDVMVTVKEAEDHFGLDQGDRPACQIKADEGGLVRAIRFLEERNEELHSDACNENTQADRRMANMASQHYNDVRHAEENGFHKGISVGPERAKKFLDFCLRVFPGVAQDRKERASRFLEEATELAQACSVSEETVNLITRRCYSRPAGSIEKEMAQSQLTLEIFHENEQRLYPDELHRSLHELANNEAERCYKIPDEEWYRRHQAKTDAGIAGQIKKPDECVLCHSPSCPRLRDHTVDCNGDTGLDRLYDNTHN